MGFLFAAMQVLNSCEKCKPEYKYIKMPVLRFFMRSSFFAEVDADRCIEIPEKLLAYLKKEGKIQGIYLYRAKEAADGFSPAMSRLKEILYSCASYVAVGEKIK